MLIDTNSLDMLLIILACYDLGFLLGIINIFACKREKKNERD
jgi:hypothetical protein